jgi:hypothetical protein
MVGESAVYSSLDAASTELSWRVISSIYGVGVGICAALAIIEYTGVAKGVADFSNSWLMFVPFVPCFVYGMARLYLQPQPPSTRNEESKKER